MPSIYRNISCLITNEGVVKKGGKYIDEKDLGCIQNAALVFDQKKGVLWSGADSELPKKFSRLKKINCKGMVAYPGLVDAHTHPVFAGDRSREFELRMQGATYQEIANAGGGIVSSVEQTRKASATDLEKLLLARLKNAAKFGVRLLEAKSGYGLSVDSELLSLQAIKNVQKKYSAVDLVATCLAAHAIPKEKKQNREAYLREILEEILPVVAKKKLAHYVDVFCDEGYFSVSETIQIMGAAKKLGFFTRIHGEELSHTGIAEKAAELGAHSVDHLLKIDERGIKAMSAAGSVGILLPGTSFYLKAAPAPARKMLDHGMIVALATDFNPGTCPTQNLPFIGSLAAITLGMKTAEIIAALTWNGARSLRKENLFGALLPGFKGKPVFCEGDHPSALFYRLAPAELVEPGIRT